MKNFNWNIKSLLLQNRSVLSTEQICIRLLKRESTIKNAPTTSKIPARSQELKEENEMLQNIMNSCAIIVKKKKPEYKKMSRGKKNKRLSKIFE